VEQAVEHLGDFFPEQVVFMSEINDLALGWLGDLDTPSHRITKASPLISLINR
jgi:hypothetical protein